jgi:hypothetical protein
MPQNAANGVLVTSTQYDRPHRPWPIRALNAVGRHVPSAELAVDDLIAAARRKAGLQDFGDEWFREPLGVLVKSLNEEARLAPMGKLIQRGRLVGALVTRLRAEALFAEHPEMLERELGEVVVIAGLQRTGTTMLHRLLSADPQIRALMSWEALNPVPDPGERPGNPRGRIRKGKLAERGLAFLAPEFFAIHPVEHDSPEEDVLLLDCSFMSQSPEAMLHVPSYAEWLESQDHTPAYEYLRKLMQLLLWQQPASHWVLKSPHHMEYLDTLLRVFPEAHVVQTHRDPRKTTASFCSMVAHGMGVFSDEVDAHEAARHWVRKIRRLMEQSIAVREELGESRFLDVSYYDLMKDPMAELDRIYHFAGIDRNERARDAAAQMRERNVQHKYGRHHYGLADFGLSPESIEEAFGFYRKRYGIPIED